MAKFCIHCGKPLEEGEVCTCPEAVAENATTQTEANENQTPVEEVTAETPATPTPQPTNNTEGTTNASSNEFVEKLKLVFSKFVDYFKSPVSTAKEFAAKNDKIYGILMICMNLIVVFLLTLLLVGTGADALRSIPLLGYMLGNSTFPIALMFTVVFATSYFVKAGMFVLTTKSMFKGTMTFNCSVSIVGVTAFINAVVTFVSIILMFISPALGLIVLALGMIYSSLIEYVSYVEMADISSDKKVFALLISAIGVFLAVYIASTVMGAIVGSSMSSSFGGSYSSFYY